MSITVVRDRQLGTIELFRVSPLSAFETLTGKYISYLLFGGMFLSLQAFWEPVRLISWLLPATYATTLLQNIMLRGTAPDTLLLGGLTAFGLILFVVNLILLHRKMARA